jgi:hypothetical protein
MDEKELAILNLLAEVMVAYFNMFRSGVSAGGFREVNCGSVIT